MEERSGVIVAAEISDNPADYWGLKAMVEQVEKNVGQRPEKVLADSGYDSYDNLGYLSEKGISGYIPNQNSQGIQNGKVANAEFDSSRFTYNKGKDIYTCPMGKPLHYQKRQSYKGIPGGLLYKCDACHACDCRANCTRAEYRTICINPREHLAREMDERLTSSEGRKIYSARKWMIEPIFGDMKYNRNMRELKLRGKRKAAGEFLIMCITHNIRKIAKRIKELGGAPSCQQDILAGGSNRGVLGCQAA